MLDYKSSLLIMLPLKALKVRKIKASDVCRCRAVPATPCVQHFRNLLYCKKQHCWSAQSDKCQSFHAIADGKFIVFST
jgi:hypothetical protein